MSDCCCFCGEEIFPAERAEMYPYCLADVCQTVGVKQAVEAWRREWTPALLHKQGYVWVKRGNEGSLRVK